MVDGIRKIFGGLSLRRSLIFVSLGLASAAMAAIVISLAAISQRFSDSYYERYKSSWIRQSDAYFRSILAENENVVQDIFLALVARGNVLGSRGPAGRPDYPFVRELDSVLRELYPRMEYVDDVYVVGVGASFAYRYSGKTLNGSILDDPMRVRYILDPGVPSGTPYYTASKYPYSRSLAGRGSYVYKRPLVLSGGEVGGYVVLALSDRIFDEYFARVSRDGPSVEAVPRGAARGTPAGLIGTLSSFPVDVVEAGGGGAPRVGGGPAWGLAAAALACLAMCLAISRLLVGPTLAPLTAVLARAESPESIEAQRGRIALSPTLISLLRFFCLGALAPVMLFSLVSVRLEYAAQWERIASYAAESLEGEQVAFDHYYGQLREVSSQILYGDALQKLFSSESARRMVPREEVERATAPLPYLRLYDRRGQVFYSSIPSELQSLASLPDIGERVLRSERFGLRFIGRRENYFQRSVLIFAQKVYSLRLPGKVLGYASLFLPGSYLDAALVGIYPSETSDVSLVDEFGGVTPMKVSGAADRLSNLSLRPAERAIVSGDDGKELALEAATSESGFRLRAVIPLREFAEKLVPLSYSSVIIIIAALFAVLVLTFFLAYEMTLPIQRLLGRVGPAGFPEGADPRYAGRNEIMLLRSRIDDIIERNRRLREENEKARIREKELVILEREAQLNALQQQINPHFLYNTLETIKWLAYKRGQTEIVKMVTALSRCFRRSIAAKGGPTTVDEELAVLGEYMYIQKIRYGDRFVFAVEMDEGAGSCAVPKFIIQPLVENAVGHGMAGIEGGGRISLSIRLRGGSLIVEVADNGAGMDGRALEQLREGLASDGASIGLRNVYARLRLLYGERSSLAIESAAGVGTKVRLSFPSSSPPAARE